VGERPGKEGWLMASHPGAVRENHTLTDIFHFSELELGLHPDFDRNLPVVEQITRRYVLQAFLPLVYQLVTPRISPPQSSDCHPTPAASCCFCEQLVANHRQRCEAARCGFVVPNHLSALPELACYCRSSYRSPASSSPPQAPSSPFSRHSGHYL